MRVVSSFLAIRDIDAIRQRARWSVIGPLEKMGRGRKTENKREQMKEEASKKRGIQGFRGLRGYIQKSARLPICKILTMQLSVILC